MVYVKTADHNRKETQNYSMVLDENKKIETHPLENHFEYLIGLLMASLLLASWWHLQY
jgi:hypothetical protein